MLSVKIVHRGCALLSAGVLIACSDQTPVSPETADISLGPPGLEAQPVLGTYDLEFSWSGTALTIITHVRAGNDEAPEGGSVTIQYCSLKGLPPDDITQPDEAPASACEDRSGRWRTLDMISLDPSGDAAYYFGPVTVVTVIGFRFTYSGRGSGVEHQTVVEDWYRPL